MDARQHWNHVYQTKAADAVSWYRPHLEKSLALVKRAAGYRDVTVLDISPTAIEVAKKRLGSNADRVTWLAADITEADLPQQRYDVWHDRAVFHFLTEPRQRAAYVRQVARAVKPGGHVIVAAFGPEGPQQCSGLDVVRYDADALHDEFGNHFRLVDSTTELHETPFGTTQQFVYCLCKLE